MKLLVFGSRGFLGKVVTRRAQEKGMVVLEASSSLGNGLDPVTGLLPKGFQLPLGTDTVIYLSQSPHSAEGIDGASHAMAVNALAPVQIATIAAKSNVSRFIYVSTGTVYGPSFLPLSESSPLRRDSWYSLSKIHAEESLQLMRSQLDITVVRPFTLYGSGQSGRLVPKLVDSIRSGRKVMLQPPVAGQAESQEGGLRISLCHVEDAADALLHFAEHGAPPLINLASAEALSLREIAHCLGERMRATPEFKLDVKPRSFDLVAETTLLAKFCPVRFRLFREGLASLFDEAQFDAR